MFITSLFQLLFISLAVLTSVGSVVQDTKLNKALEVTAPLSSVSTEMSSNLDTLNEAVSHTHVEKPSLAQEFAGIPRVQTRDDHRKYVMPKTSGRRDLFTGTSGIVWPN